MIKAKAIGLVLGLALTSFAQTQTTGRIAGTVRDQLGAVIVGASVKTTNQSTAETRMTLTDDSGNFAIAFLSPGVYRLHVESAGFNNFQSESVAVSITETTTVDVQLDVGQVVADPITVASDSAIIKTDSPTLGQVFTERSLAELPLASRNFTQLLALTPGASAYLTDNTIVGRNSQNVSVNGSRVSQNNIQLNGIDAAGASAYVLPLSLPVPALESIAELKVQTSLYDATFGRAGGGSIQAITKSGSNKFRGSVYDYFRNTALTANNPFLKAAGVRRPVLERNVFGFVLGGAIKKDRAFFFGSYQTTRERNGASRTNSLSVNVLIDPRLTDDRSEATLRSTYPTIQPTALAFLRARFPNGQFLIPTPQVNGRYSGSAVSRFREEQFNANFDFRLTQKNWLSAKFFFSNAPAVLARVGVINVPGFGARKIQNHRLISIQDVQSFNTDIANELRVGYSYIREDNFPNEPFLDSAFGITRPTADDYPGLPAININQNAGGIQFGTAALQASLATAPTTSLSDTVSITRGHHAFRLGGEIRYYESNFTGNLVTRGTIFFQNFASFLTGTTQIAQIGIGLDDRSFRTTDYNFFAQDDWNISPKLTLNLGLRYELDLPPYETRGRFGAFDPSLYRPRRLLINGLPAGPPVGGFVQANNAITQYDLPDVPNVSKRILNSIDPNNFAPRLGFAYSPFKSNLAVVRGGYGIFYSRSSFQNAGGSSYIQPFYFVGTTFGLNVGSPFANADAGGAFPKFVIGQPLSGNAVDRNNRTPYFEQYNLVVQFGLSENSVLELAYVGTHGRKLFHSITINQARLASPEHPIVNEVTQLPITINTPGNAQLRAPFQGVLLGSNFWIDRTSGTSAYNSLQASFSRRLSRGLQFLASYTFAKSIDDGSGTGGGSGTNGVVNTAQINDTNVGVINSLDGGAARGVSDFDRTHRFVASFLWEVPKPAFASHSKIGRVLFSNWQMSGIVTAMSGLPIDIVDSVAGSLYVGANAGVGRPNFAAGANRATATSSIPAGYFFNPLAFVRPRLTGGQPIPSSGGAFFADVTCSSANVVCTDFGNVGRNILRGPAQFNIDLSVGKRFRFNEARNIEIRVEAFNLFNTVNFANPISNLNAGTDFGRIISTSNNPRMIQLAVKLDF